ncbi:hypothetical protein ANCCAN_09604 [Ancylostoma caninum]|uniref:Uncharacterized protein n=1 Tax=Ancylostoma caninum TaxID=29170 RepID=A0A368GMV3_ANCCA|nr:hypothetical protein ANCCAN_09604 [Ancylostoma caninum]
MLLNATRTEDSALLTLRIKRLHLMLREKSSSTRFVPSTANWSTTGLNNKMSLMRRR